MASLDTRLFGVYMRASGEGEPVLPYGLCMSDSRVLLGSHSAMGLCGGNGDDGDMDDEGTGGECMGEELEEIEEAVTWAV